MDTDRRDSELQRLWREVHAHEKEIEALEKLVGGMHYALFGIPERPESGMIKTVDNLQQEIHRFRNTIAALIATGLVGLGTQLLVHFT